MDNETTWKMREAKLRREIRGLCNEAIDDARQDRLRAIANDLFELRQQMQRGHAARRRGRVGGRKRSMTPGKVESARKLLKGGMAPREVAQNPERPARSTRRSALNGSRPSRRQPP
jgi:hypothetical protein